MNGTTPTQATLPKVVIVGAGFGGLYATKALKGEPVDVSLIDQNNYHTFQPLLYQVAAAGLEPADIARQVRAIFARQANLSFRQGTVTGVDWDAKTVLLAEGKELAFDYLILGLGALYNDFGTPGVKDHAFFLKSLTEAANISAHILRQFERATAEPELIEQGILDFVVVGGGPTGVELCGALSELLRGPIRRDFPEYIHERARIIMFERGGAVLVHFSAASSRYTQKVLERDGVEI